MATDQHVAKDEAGVRVGDTGAEGAQFVARKTAVPADQLDRLRDLYNQERNALVALANAEQIVSDREDELDAARRALKEAQAGADVVYQDLVELVGAGVAAELTGRGKTGGRRPRDRPKATNASAPNAHTGLATPGVSAGL